MIVTKNPLRISFFGGGSDLQDFYNNNEGFVVSTAINSYMYIALNKCVAPHIKMIYSELELVKDIEELKHDIVREVLKYYKIYSNIEICSFSDVNTKGTGLGSSSTFTVGLINAIHTLKHIKPIDPYELAELASYIEIDRCGQPIGKQDQYLAAYGGFRTLTFTKNKIIVQRPHISYSTIQNLNRRLLCFNTGISRSAGSILGEHVKRLKSNINVEMTKTLVEMAHKSVEFLENDQLNDFGNLMDDAWQIKKQLSENISNPHIDEMYDRALTAGALGGKLLGAGGGGYLLVYVPDDYIYKVSEEMKEFEKLDFKINAEGSKVEMS